eukprot:COSAG04_NODE_18133_length_450_cov_0.737892_1_plen_27_part_01
MMTPNRRYTAPLLPTPVNGHPKSGSAG